MKTTRRVLLGWLAGVAGGALVGQEAAARPKKPKPTPTPTPTSTPPLQGVYSDIYSDTY